MGWEQVDTATVARLELADAEDPRCGSSGGVGKILNARPCARCEMKMVERGVRRCYFTLNRSTVGVLEYNPDAF